MEDFSRAVMLALLPVNAEWCRIELPHMTLVYAGKMDQLTPADYNELGKDTLRLSKASPPLVLDVIGVDIFGDEEPVDVLLLEETPALTSMRASVERWNASDHPFNPHVTVGPVGSLEGTVPSQILFDKVSFNWGDRGFNCNLTPDHG